MNDDRQKDRAIDALMILLEKKTLEAEELAAELGFEKKQRRKLAERNKDLEELRPLVSALIEEGKKQRTLLNNATANAEFYLNTTKKLADDLEHAVAELDAARCLLRTTVDRVWSLIHPHDDPPPEYAGAETVFAALRDLVSKVCLYEGELASMDSVIVEIYRLVHGTDDGVEIYGADLVYHVGRVVEELATLRARERAY